jgi:hypothetical protein
MPTTTSSRELFKLITVTKNNKKTTNEHTTMQRISLDECKRQNDAVKHHFETQIVPKFIALLHLAHTVKFVMTGSRASGLSYPESDIDCAFVADDMHMLNYIANELKSHSQQLGLGTDLKIVHTKAGLPWCPVENYHDEHIGPIKLDITFRLSDVHNQIQEHVNNNIDIQFPSDEDKEDYINSMRLAHNSNDTVAYDKLKEWLRVLPSK